MKEFIQKIIDWVMGLFGEGTSKQAPYPEFSDYYKQKVVEHKANPTSGKVMMIGDSITDGQSCFSQYFPEGVVNRGIAGDTTMGVLARLSDLVKESPRKVFILIGTNNLGWGTPEAEGRVVTDILLIAHVFYTAGSKVYVQSILPVNTEFEVTKLRDKKKIQHINRLLEAYSATIKTYEFLNLHPEFVGDTEGNMSKKYTDDGLHLNEEGYKRWGELISPMMD